LGSMDRNHNLGFAILGVWGSSERATAVEVGWWSVGLVVMQRGAVCEGLGFLGLFASDFSFCFFQWLLELGRERAKEEKNKGSGTDDRL